MSGEILNSILNKINRKLRHDRRFVLLLMDNAGCHPPDIVDKYSNIKIVFLPPNTISKLQPLDLGIIKNFKTHYRKFLMRYVITKIEECSSAAEVVKSVNVLHAIRWIAEAWKCVQSTVILKCFRKAGILDRGFNVREPLTLTEDPFSDLDEETQGDSHDSELADLIRQVNGDDQCTVESYICADEDLPTCLEMDNENWEEDFFAELGSKRPHLDENVQDDDEDNDNSTEDVDIDVPPKLTSFSEALTALEDVSTFLESKGYASEATDVMAFSSKVSFLHCKHLTNNSKQTSLLDYISKD